MNLPRILIEVRDGQLAAVWADRSAIEVDVLDHDVTYCEDDALAEARRPYPFRLGLPDEVFS